MSGSPRYLTKTRFKLGAECPRKLFYVGKREFLDRSVEDSFLAALAEGGYQVGELACLMHPEGVRVDELDHQKALEHTNELLKRDKVAIFEAALSVGDLFVRVDLLHKDGNNIEIVEVKAKSFSPRKDGTFCTKDGKPTAAWRPYLLDVAFQRFVAQSALKGMTVRAFLMLVDKERIATVDGLNQRFKAYRENGRLRIKVTDGTKASDLGAALLAKISVDSQVDGLLASTLKVGPGSELPFTDAVATFAAAYVADRPLPAVPSKGCSNCQFKAETWPDPKSLRSGFHECWSECFGMKERDFDEGTVLDLWNFRKKDDLIAQGILKPNLVQMEDLKFDGQPPGLAGMSWVHRQWYLCQPDWPGGGEFYFNKEGYESARAAWTYPLHCIDFETSAVAIPFIHGRHPYELTAFQFSHHVIHQDGRVEHRTQWLCTEPGVDPNVAFVRALKAALEGDKGTIFRWAPHENTVLNKIREQMLTSGAPPADRDELVAFIESITYRGSGKDRVAGPREMVDLCDIAEKYYFHPSTKGSTSLKKVLPALMSRSQILRRKYEQRTYGGEGVSLNFTEPVAWWQQKNGKVSDPYELLPPIFDDVAAAETAAAEEGLSEELREGGAAMAAYGRLQFEDLPEDKRQAINSALLRYCELDTLAMVMAVEAWNAAADE